jgi:hypothetical protein
MCQCALALACRARRHQAAWLGFKFPGRAGRRRSPQLSGWAQVARQPEARPGHSYPSPRVVTGSFNLGRLCRNGRRCRGIVRCFKLIGKPQRPLHWQPQAEGRQGPPAGPSRAPWPGCEPEPGDLAPNLEQPRSESVPVAGPRAGRTSRRSPSH